MLPMSRHASTQTDRGFNVHDRSDCGGWLPAAGRQQRAEVVLVGHTRQELEHVGEVGFRAVDVAAALHQVADDRSAPPGGFVPTEAKSQFRPIRHKSFLLRRFDFQ